jgi:hypothetical protein
MFLAERLSPFVKNLIVIKGGMGQKQRRQMAEKIDGIPKNKEVLIYDYADLGVPMLAKMYERRRAGYKAIGYEIDEKFVCV